MEALLNYLLISLAVIALFGVMFEERTHVSKAKITLACGCLSWVLLFIAAAGTGESVGVATAFHENIGEIANLWLFLIAAMTFVAYLNQKGLIDAAIRVLLPKSLSERGLLFLTACFCFVFSSLADNITATLVSIALVLSLQLEQKSTHRFAVIVVFAVNSGGVSLITGDVTTLMIFLENRVSIKDLLLLSMPSFAATLLLATLLSFGLSGDVIIERRGQRTNAGPDRREASIHKVDILIAVLFLCTIILTMAGSIVFGIPPVLSFLTGLAVMFLVARFLKKDIWEDPILEYIRMVEFETLFFFLGVLLIVGMLAQIGALEHVTTMYQHLAPTYTNYIVGLVSAVIDNVPLTAALLKADPTMTAGQWLTLTYSVGVGGSLLIIGSAAGIVCMTKIPSLTVSAYLRFLPHLLFAYSVGYICASLIEQLR